MYEAWFWAPRGSTTPCQPRGLGHLGRLLGLLGASGLLAGPQGFGRGVLGRFEEALMGDAGDIPRAERCDSMVHTTGLPHFQFTAFSSFLLEIGILSKIE